MKNEPLHEIIRLFVLSAYLKVGRGDNRWNTVSLTEEVSPSRFRFYSQYAPRPVPLWSR